MSAVHTFKIVRIRTLVSKEHVQKSLNQPLKPPFACIFLLVVMGLHRDLFQNNITTMLASILHLTIFGTGCCFGDFCLLVGVPSRGNRFVFLIGTSSANTVLCAVSKTFCRSIYNPFTPCVTVCVNVIVTVGISANTSMEIISLLGAGRRNGCRFMGMSEGVHIIGTVPLTADGAFVLIIALLGAGGRHPNCLSVDMIAAIMPPFRIEAHILRDSHTISVTYPAEEFVSLLGGIFGQGDFGAVRKYNLIKHSHLILVVEGYGIGVCDTVHNRTGGNIHRGSCGNGIGNAVTVQIPTAKHVGVLCVTIGSHIGRTNHLRSHKDLAAQQTSVCSVEISGNPFVAVNHFVSVVPVGEVFVPLHVFFIGFNINRNTSNVFE